MYMLLWAVNFCLFSIQFNCAQIFLLLSHINSHLLTILIKAGCIENYE